MRRPGPPDPHEPVVLDLDWRSSAALVVATLGLFAAFGVARETRATLTWLAVGTLLALALNPVVRVIERRFRVHKKLAVGFVIGVFVVAAALVVLVLGPRAIQEARQFQQDLPEVLDSMGDLPLIGDDLREADVPAKVEEWLDDLPETLGRDTEPLEEITRSALGGALAVFSTLLVAVVMLLDGGRLVRASRRLVPARHRDRVDRAGDIVYRTVGRYFAGSLFVAVLSGTAMLVVGLLLRVPLIPLAAIWATVTNLIPQVGGFLGGSLFVLLGFSRSPATGLACLAYFLVWQQLENHVIQPTIVGEAVKLSPPITMIAALVGGSTAGVAGAVVAVPLIGAGKAIYLQLHPSVPEEAEVGALDTARPPPPR